MNKGVIVRFKTITTHLSTIVHLLIEPIISLAKPKASMEAYISISQLPWSVTSSNPDISPSLFSFFFFVNMLRFNRYWWGTVESHVGRRKFGLTKIMPFIEPHWHERHHPLVNGYYFTGKWKAASKNNNLSTSVWWHLIWVLLINADLLEDNMVFCREGLDSWLRGCVEFKAIKLIIALQNHSCTTILSRWAVVYSDTSTTSLPLCLEVCVGGSPGLCSLWPKFC